MKVFIKIIEKNEKNFKPSLEYDYVEKNNNQIILKIYNLSKNYQLALYLFLHFFIFLSILMVIISLELTRVNPDRNIFNKCGTNIYFFTLQRFGPSPSLNFKSTSLRIRSPIYFHLQI